MTIRAVTLTFILAILGAQTSSADTLTISTSPNTYTVSGVAGTYNTLAVRLGTPPCGARNSTKYMASTFFTEGEVKEAFSTGAIALQPGTYTLCAYLFAAPEVIVHYPEPCRELITAPVFCQTGELAEATITVEPQTSPTPVVVTIPTVTAPTVTAPTPVAVVPVAGPVGLTASTTPGAPKPKPTVCRKIKRKRHRKCEPVRRRKR